ncbi:MAG: hypothetical protein QOD42_2071 [Sphingomonadales bacterium]|jgi:hypothetical protein|nr:hypothetical protein [Sphingomonadales bacterium]
MAKVFLPCARTMRPRVEQISDAARDSGAFAPAAIVMARAASTLVRVSLASRR